jgi:hypothetical protein
MTGADIEVTSFARMRFVDELRIILQDGFQTALNGFPVLLGILEVDEMDVNDGDDGKGHVVSWISSHPPSMPIGWWSQLWFCLCISLGNCSIPKVHN